MKITATIDRDALPKIMAAYGPQFLDAGNRATERQTKETVQTMRSEITRGLSARAANAYRSKWIFNPVTGGVQVVGFTFSAWRRKPRSGGQDVDMLAAFERGEIIRPVRAKALYIALKAAYAVVGARDGKKRPTPDSVEAALDTDLFEIKRPGRPTILAAKDVNVAGGRRALKLRGRRFRNKKGSLVRRRGTNAIFPMFVLVSRTRLPKRLDFSRIEETGAIGLANKLDIELAARGVFT